MITTKRAYEELEREGFIVSYTGKGSFVARQNMDMIREQQQKEVEEHLSLAARKVRAMGISLEELTEILALLYGDEVR